MPKVEMKCHYCGKIFLQYISQRKGRFAFCSRPCKYIWNKSVTGHWKGKKMSQSAKDKMSKNHANVSGKNNPRWRGGRRIDKDGYVLIWKPDHQYSDYHGYVREHRLVMEEKIGRYLKPEEVVHHVNHRKQDNRLENLIILTDVGEHQRLHYHNGDSTHLKNYKP